MKTTTLRLEDKLYKDMKKYIADEDLSIRQFITKLIKSELYKEGVLDDESL